MGNEYEVVRGAIHWALFLVVHLRLRPDEARDVVLGDLRESPHFAKVESAVRTAVGA